MASSFVSATSRVLPWHAQEPAARLYVPPRGVPVPVAGLTARLGAAAADLFLYVLAAPFALGACAVVMRGWWPLGALAIAFAYLVFGWVTGQTPGMRLTHARIAAVHTGQAPGPWRAAVRGGLVLPQAVATFLLADALFTRGGLPAEETLVPACVAILLLGFASQSWAFWDPQGRSLHDRLSGVVILDVAPARVAEPSRR